MCTPKYSTNRYCSIASPDITKFAPKGSAVILSFMIYRGLMSIDVVLATFKDNVLPTLRFSNSVFIVLVARIVSITYIVTLEHFNALGKSLI